MSDTTLNRRVQFIWWWGRWGWPHIVRWKHGIGQILDYSIVIYPLEIRVWKAHR